MSQTFEQRVYNNYRSALRSFPHTAGSRAGERKQRARVLTSTRYNLPISKVKEIVREQDAPNGITHEHDVNYYKKLEFQETAQGMLDAHGDSDVCPTCNVTPENPEEIRIRVNPFMEEMHKEIVPMLSCFNCYFSVKYDM